jgi:hypothetical protein
MNTTPTPAAAAPDAAPPVTTNVIEGTFSLNDLMLLSPEERAVVEQDMTTGYSDEPTPAAAPEPAPAPVVEAAPAPAAPEPPAVDLNALQAAVKGNEDKLNELASRYDDGEITQAEWREQTRQLMEANANALADIKLHQRAQENANQAWFDLAGRFMKDRGITTPDHHAGFDAVVREIETNYPNLTDAEILDTAYARYFVVAQQMGKPLPSANVTGQPAPHQVTQAKAKKAATDDDDDDDDGENQGLGQPPRTISTIPAQSPGGVANGKFDAINQLIEQGRVYEAESAVSRLSAFEREQYELMG